MIPAEFRARQRQFRRLQRRAWRQELARQWPDAPLYAIACGCLAVLLVVACLMVSGVGR